jgi:hypothetical protein
LNDNDEGQSMGELVGPLPPHTTNAGRSRKRSTFRGITIDESDDDEYASDSIRVNRESDSNVIDESDPQPEKHDEQRISTFRGITID